MCASYGLDPRFAGSELLDAEHEALLDELRAWAERNAGQTLRPTGRLRRNLNPLVTLHDGAPALTDAWWGYLVGGEPAKFPSINTRSERLRERPSGMRQRAIVPATGWFEMQKPQCTWHEFALDDGALFGMAAVTQPGRTADGAEFTCYSIVMRDATGPLSSIHPRMPLLIPSDFAHEWLAAPRASADLIDAAFAASEELAGRVRTSARS